MPHRILCAPLRIYGPVPPGPIEIKMTPSGIVFITAGGKNIQVTGGAKGTWPTPVVIEDQAVLDKLRHGREVRRIQISYIDGELHVEVAEYARPTRQPMLPFGDIPARPSTPEVAVTRQPVQIALLL